MSKISALPIQDEITFGYGDKRYVARTVEVGGQKVLVAYLCAGEGDRWPLVSTTFAHLLLVDCQQVRRLGPCRAPTDAEYMLLRSSRARVPAVAKIAA